jgi:hypothetical protein
MALERNNPSSLSGQIRQNSGIYVSGNAKITIKNVGNGASVVSEFSRFRHPLRYLVSLRRDVDELRAVVFGDGSADGAVEGGMLGRKRQRLFGALEGTSLD